MRIPQQLILLLLCFLQCAVASNSDLSSDGDKSTRTNLRTRNDGRSHQPILFNQPRETVNDDTPIVSRKAKEDQNGYDMSNVDMSNMNMNNLNTDNVNMDELTQRPKELFSTPINEWTMEDWIIFGIILMLLSCLLSCLSKIGCGACNLLNCLTCYCCLSLCCGDAEAGSYVAADGLC